MNTYPQNFELQEQRTDAASSRARFVVFIQILLRRLESSGCCDMREETRRIVLRHTQLNRNGDSTPLVASLDHQLRQLVGETHWMKAQKATTLYYKYMERRRALANMKQSAICTNVYRV